MPIDGERCGVPAPAPPLPSYPSHGGAAMQLGSATFSATSGNGYDMDRLSWPKLPTSPVPPSLPAGPAARVNSGAGSLLVNSAILESVSEEEPLIPPSPVLEDNESRIPEDLAPYVAVGLRGGLVFTPFAVTGADPGDAKLERAFELVIQHSLLRATKREVNGDVSGDVCSGKAIVATAAAQMEKMNLHSGDTQPDDVAKIKSGDDGLCPPAITEETPVSTKPPVELNKFLWKKSQSRQTVIDFGRRVREHRAELEVLARSGAEQAIAAATAASARPREDGEGLLPSVTKPPSARSDDPVRWIAQEEAAVGQALRAVRTISQKRARKGGNSKIGANANGAPSEESSIWNFLMPKSGKLRPEAAAEMARAKIAAAAAVKKMMEDKEEKRMSRNGDNRLSLPSSFRDGARGSSGRRPRSADAMSTSSRGQGRLANESPLSTPERLKEGGDGLSESQSSRTSIGERVFDFGLSYPDRGDDDLLKLDDGNFLARHRRASSTRDSTTSISPMKTPGFPRELLLDATPRTPPKKKRVSFNSENTVHPI